MLSATRRSRLADVVRSRHRTIVGLAVTCTIALLGAAAVLTQPKQYVVSATVAVVGAPSIAEREISLRTTIDPSLRSWLARFDSPTVVADIYARVYKGSSKLDDLRNHGFAGELRVETRSSVASEVPGHGPVIVFIVTATDPTHILDSLDLVIADFTDEVRVAQATADPALSVTIALITESDRPLLASGSRIRSAVGFVALASLLGWVCVVTLAAIERRRARPRDVHKIRS